MMMTADFVVVVVVVVDLSAFVALLPLVSFVVKEAGVGEGVSGMWR